MSSLLGDKKLVFRPLEKFMVDLKNMGRQDKIDKINFFSQHDRYRVQFYEGFIHLLDSIMVEKGEWVEIYAE
jgi:hypothetical protein